MSKSVITDGLLTAIADAIRAKTGDDGALTPAQMAQAIEGIPQGAKEPYVEYTITELGTSGAAKMYGFTAIPKYFFSGVSGDEAGWANVEVPEGVTIIRKGAFASSGLHQISLPDSLETIESNAFELCHIESISLPDGLKSIGDHAFNGCGLLESCIFPDDIESINSASMFTNCSNLEIVNFPAAWTSIADYTFAACTSLRLSKIPAHITTIGTRAFNNCTSLTELDIMGATSLTGQYSIGRCSHLTTIKFHQTPSSINTQAFSSDSALTDIYVPWSNGAVAGAPWGATNASIHYDTQYDENGNVIS